LHQEHERIEWTEPHGSREVVNCKVGLAKKGSHPSAGVPRRRQIRIEPKRTKLKQRLGIDVGIGDPLLDKPKGMWTRTYASLLDEILQAEILTNEAQSNMFKRLVQVKNDRC
jgi:hypothetical protein